MSKIPTPYFRLIGAYVVENVLPNKNSTARKINAKKSQLLHRIRLRNQTTKTPLEDSYFEENFKTGDHIVIPQEILYRTLWEADSNTSVLDYPRVYRDPITPEYAHS